MLLGPSVFHLITFSLQSLILTVAPEMRLR